MNKTQTKYIGFLVCFAAGIMLGIGHYYLGGGLAFAGLFLIHEGSTG